MKIPTDNARHKKNEQDLANKCLEFSLEGKLKFPETCNLLNKIIVVLNDLYEDHQTLLTHSANSGH